ncbi:hypothetical protein [Pontimicrobium sp. MEBiC06410]
MTTLLKNIVTIWNKYALGITVFFVVCLLSLLSFQGFDMCDEGWYMTFYQQIFNAPETVEYNFAFWLTGIVGGIWYELFSEGGILSFRVLSIVIIVATIIIAYMLLSRYIKKEYVIVGLLMVMLVNDFGYLAFYYNHLSGFLAVCIVYFIDKGLRKQSLLELAIAGLLTAVNVFSRLPNVTLFVLLLVFPAQYFFDTTTTKKYILKQIVAFLGGSILGFVIVYLVMLSLGHIDVFKNAVSGIINKGSNADSNHNITRLLGFYAKEYIKIIKFSLNIIPIAIVIAIMSSYSKRVSFLKPLAYIIGVGIIAFLFRKDAVYSLYCLGLMGAIYLILAKTITPAIKSIAFLALVIAVLLPMGSDGGIHNAGYVCIWLILPVFMHAFATLQRANMQISLSHGDVKLNVSKHDFNTFLIILVISFFIVKGYKISKEAYFDAGSRLHKTYTIHNTLANVYTTKERADITNAVLQALKPHVKPGDYLLAYDNIPMLNYLTKTKPYMGISWVWVYDSKTFETKIKQAEETIPYLPIVVQQKFRTIVSFTEPDENYMSETKEESYIYKRGRVIAMNNFLKRNNYEVIWSNSHFNILKSNPSKY